MSIEVAAYAFRGIIRHLNGDQEEFSRLTSIAMQEYRNIEYNKKSICSIGEILPKETKEQLYTVAGGIN
ncbi:hypothetical protein [Abyssisolibacter fermentans]|uniref:hypothetical protein n=1 Tax=Abyssisolibacter fermentans TaxID=1766203 RepID=UPI00082F69F6|nr:hypothetical protein [Abyssisolibacter fermentans]